MSSPVPKKLDVLIVDNDIDVRMRLRHATTSAFSFGVLLQANTLIEGVRMLESDEHKYDLVFISYQFSNDLCTDFITQGKTLPGGEDAAYVRILGARDEKNSTVANSIMAGADGFLFEPYSIDDLVNMSHLAARVKTERSAARELIAVKFMVADIIKYLSLACRFKATGCEYVQTQAKLEEVCGRVKSLQSLAQKRYFELLIDQFMLRPVPDPNIKDLTYKGRNARVRSRIEEKVLNGIDRKSRNETELGTKLKTLPPPGKASSTP